MRLRSGEGRAPLLPAPLRGLLERASGGASGDDLPLIVRALVLAAGLGTRLRPLTEEIPKPLLPVAGLPLLARTLEQLARAGCEAAAVNLHHRGERIRSALGGSFAGLPLVYSEEREIQGTLGALHPLRGFLAPADLVLLVNGDSLCRWPLARLLAAHLRARTKGARATLLFSRRASPAAFGGGVAIDRQGFVVSFLPGEVMPDRPVARRLVFAGAHVLDAALVARIAALPPGPADIVRDLYQPMLRAPGAVETTFAAVTTDRIWHDLGTPRRYLEGVLDWSRAGGRPTWISPAAEVGEGARLRRAIVEAGARIGAGARLEKALVLAGAEVGAGCIVRDAIVGPGAALPAGARLEGRLAMPGAVGAEGPRLTPLDGPGEG